MAKQLEEMDKQTRSKLCKVIIDLKNISEEYNLTEIRSYGIKITIEPDRDEELMVKLQKQNKLPRQQNKQEKELEKKYLMN